MERNEIKLIAENTILSQLKLLKLIGIVDQTQIKEIFNIIKRDKQ